MFRRTSLQPTYLFAMLLLVFAGAFAQEVPQQQPVPPGGDFAPLTPPGAVQKVPEGVNLVKGAEPSASDGVTPLPEGGTVLKNVYKNSYFGLTYPLPADWEYPFGGPPPSETGAYVLANVIPSKSHKGASKGTIMFTAQDMFFAVAPAENAKELVSYKRDHLESYYDVEKPPTEITIAGRTWARFDYTSAVAGIHWVILATQVRCHALQFVLTSRDPQLNEELIKQLDSMTLPADAGATSGKGGGDFPLCVADYARPQNIVEKVDPDIPNSKANGIPVRIIIDPKGRVKHVHVVSAHKDQAAAVTTALLNWKFKPYMRDGKPVEIETGLVFGNPMHRRAPNPSATTAAKAASD